MTNPEKKKLIKYFCIYYKYLDQMEILIFVVLRAKT